MTKKSGKDVGEPKPPETNVPATDSKKSESTHKTPPTQIPTLRSANVVPTSQSSRPQSKPGLPNGPVQKNSDAPIAFSKIKYSKVAGSRSAGVKSRNSETKATSASKAPVIPDKSFVADKSPNQNYIPKQQQITPELEAQLRERARLKHRVKWMRSSLKRLGIALLFMTIAAASAGYFYYADQIQNPTTKENKTISATPDAAPPATSLAAMLNRDDVPGLLRYSVLSSQKLHKSDLPNQLLVYQDQTKIGTRLIDLNFNDETFIAGVKLQINGLISLASLNARNDLGLKGIYDELTKCSEQKKDSKNPVVAAFGRVGLLHAKIHQFLRDDSVTNFKNLQQILSQPINETETSIFQYFTIAHVLIGFCQQPSEVFELRQTLAQNLKSSPQPELQVLGERMFDESVTGLIDLEILQKMLSICDETAVKQLRQIVTNIEQSPDVSFVLYMRVMSAIEELEQALNLKSENLNVELAQPKIILEKLERAAMEIKDPIIKEKVAKSFPAHRTRSQLVGTQFDFSSYSTNAKLFNKNSKHIAVIFMDSSFDSAMEYLEQLELCASANRETQCLIVWTDQKPLAPEPLERFESAMPSGIFIESPVNHGFIAQCPISWSPYIILIDRLGEVSGINLSIDNLNELNRSYNKKE